MTEKWDKEKMRQSLTHSDLNDQNLFHSTIDTAPGVPGVLKKEDNQTEVHSGELEY